MLLYKNSRTCNNCPNKRHFGNVCMPTKKSLNYLDNQNTPPKTPIEALEENNFFTDAIYDISNEVKNNQQINTITEEKNTEWSAILNTCVESHLILRCSSQCSSRKSNSANKTKNNKINDQLGAYNWSSNPVKGQCALDIQHCCNNVPLLCIVAYTNFSPIIGLNSRKQLNPIERILSISNSQKRNFLNEYKDYFVEIGTLPKFYHITIDQNIIPVVTLATKDPLALLDKPKLELERMQRVDIVEPVSEWSNWVNPLIIVKKPNGELWICLDPKYSNQAMWRQHYKLPTAEELFSGMNQAEFFTKLDASSG